MNTNEYPPGSGLYITTASGWYVIEDKAGRQQGSLQYTLAEAREEATRLASVRREITQEERLI